MRRSLAGILTVLPVAVLVAGAASSQPLEDIMVRASRSALEVQTLREPRSVVGWQEISMTYRAAYGDLDLATPEGKEQLKARVRQAAEEACKDIDAQFPLAGPKGARCVDAAVDAAKPQIRQALAVASKPVTKM